MTSSSRGSAVLLGAGAFVLVAATQGAKPSQKEISKELRELYESDQKDQNDPAWTEATDAESAHVIGSMHEAVDARHESAVRRLEEMLSRESLKVEKPALQKALTEWKTAGQRASRKPKRGTQSI